MELSVNCGQQDTALQNYGSLAVGLSTANNSFSDYALIGGRTMVFSSSGNSLSGMNIFLRRLITVAAKTTYYLVERSGVTVDSLRIDGRTGEAGTNIIKATCAFL
jgi:hypothetical protein